MAHRHKPVRSLVAFYPQGQPRRWRQLVHLGAAVSAAALTFTSLAGPATAAGLASFTFSGAVNGTLRISEPPCSEVGGYGGQLGLYGSLKGSSIRQWQVDVNALKAGTYKSFKRGRNGVASASIVLSGATSTTDYWWISTSGELTTTKTSGKFKITLGPDTGAASGVAGKGTIHLSGSYKCNPS